MLYINWLHVVHIIVATIFNQIEVYHHQFYVSNSACCPSNTHKTTPFATSLVHSLAASSYIVSMVSAYFWAMTLCFIFRVGVSVLVKGLRSSGRMVNFWVGEGRGVINDQQSWTTHQTIASFKWWTIEERSDKLSTHDYFFVWGLEFLLFWDFPFADLLCQIHSCRTQWLNNPEDTILSSTNVPGSLCLWMHCDGLVLGYILLQSHRSILLSCLWHSLISCLTAIAIKQGTISRSGMLTSLVHHLVLAGHICQGRSEDKVS